MSSSGCWRGLGAAVETSVSAMLRAPGRPRQDADASCADQGGSSCLAALRSSTVLNAEMAVQHLRLVAYGLRGLTPARSRQSFPRIEVGSACGDERRVLRGLFPLAVQLAQLGLQYLAIVVLGQVFEEDVVARPLEPGDGVETERVQLGRGYFLRRARHHAGNDFFPPIGVRAADH